MISLFQTFKKSHKDRVCVCCVCEREIKKGGGGVKQTDGKTELKVNRWSQEDPH